MFGCIEIILYQLAILMSLLHELHNMAHIIWAIHPKCMNLNTGHNIKIVESIIWTV